jgi:ABC-type multidrug transport system permease subunit
VRLAEPPHGQWPFCSETPDVLNNHEHYSLSNRKTSCQPLQFKFIYILVPPALFLSYLLFYKSDFNYFYMRTSMREYYTIVGFISSSSILLYGVLVILFLFCLHVMM